MWTSVLLTGLALLLAGLVTAVVLQRRRLHRTRRALVDGLLSAADTPDPAALHTDEVDALPPPIRRYLTHVLPSSLPCIRAVRMRQRGTFRSATAEAPWSPFTATQHVTLQPPGFVWDAAIALMPGISVRVLDAYHDGHGCLQARLGGVVPVADAAPSPALDEGELVRYLAEAPLYPLALLPGLGVTWTALGNRSARATLRHRGTTASIVFHVNAHDEVERVTGTRPFRRDDGTYEVRPWRGAWRNYEVRRGLRVPVDGQVAWVGPDGAVPYWRGHVESIDYLSATVSSAPDDRSPIARLSRSMWARAHRSPPISYNNMDPKSPLVCAMSNPKKEPRSYIL